MDSFEIRVKFGAMLEHMNASMAAALKAASYALKHKEQDEDLHSVILEQLEKNPTNNRANVMFFLETLCEVSKREKQSTYPKMIERDIVQIVNLVAPAGGKGNVNVSAVRKVLCGLQKENILEQSTVKELEELLAERELPVGDNLLTEENLSKLSKRETEQRIEEDRERHKRLRESIWAISAKDLAEWQAIVDDCSEINSDDGREAGEETGERDDAEQFA